MIASMITFSWNQAFLQLEDLLGMSIYWYNAGCIDLAWDNHWCAHFRLIIIQHAYITQLFINHLTNCFVVVVGRIVTESFSNRFDIEHYYLALAS